MTFEEILDQAIAMLQRRGRVTYQTLRLQFQLDEEHLEALKDAILFAYPQVVDAAGRGLVWSGEAGAIPPSTPASPQAEEPSVTLAPHVSTTAVAPPKPYLPDAERRVAYPWAADKYLRPLASRLSSVNQPVMLTRNAFSTPRPTPWACL
jgi:hypothetical protein